MKKTLLILFTLLLSTLAYSAQQDLSISDLGSTGWGGSSSDGKGAVSYTTAWTGCGWNLAPNDVPTDFSQYNKVVVSFKQPLPFLVRIVVEYDGVSSTQVDVPAGATAGEVYMNPDGTSKVTQIYLQCGEIASVADNTIYVEEAYLTYTPPSSVIDFESDDIGKVYPAIAWNAPDINAVVENNPAGNGNVLHVTTGNYNAYPKFHVILPDNKTLGDVLKVAFDIFFVDNESGQNNYKNIDYFIGNTGASFSAGTVTGSDTNTIGSNEATGTWITKEFVINKDKISDLLGLNEFDFGMGISFNKDDYYIDNITFIDKPVTGVSLDQTAVELIMDNTQQLTATVSPSDATNLNVIWNSSDNSVATVSSNGLVTPVSEGTTTVSVTTKDGGFNDKCDVTVIPITTEVASVSLDQTEVEMTIGDTQQLTATVLPSDATNKDVTWSSSNEAVATVSDDGTITAIGEGVAMITVTTNNGKFTADCEVSVSYPVEELTVDPTNGNILLNQFDGYSDNAIVTIYLSITNSSGTDVGWGIGKITDIAYAKDNTVFATISLAAKAVSAEGAVNTYQFTVAELKAMASIPPSDLETLKSESSAVGDKIYGKDWTVNDQNYIVDNNEQIGVTVNVYNGASLTNITIQESDGLTPSSVLDFESDKLGTAYPTVSYNKSDITAIVEKNPTDNSGKALHVTTSNYDAIPIYHVLLPDNKTVGDISKVTADIYFVDNGSDQNSFKAMNYFIGKTGASFSAGSPTGKTGNIIRNDSIGFWMTKEITLAVSDNDLLGLNEFDFGLGISCQTGDYYIDNITFELKTGPTVLPPSSDAPGVHVFDMYGEGDAYSGANIILGSDASQWPWSTAGSDGVAFTPEKDATYHMTFSATSTGEEGFFIRWIKDDTNDSYTVGDNKVVKSPNNGPFTADQTPVVVPAFFENTITKGDTVTYSVDFTMDGSQLADSLIGNLAIRGQDSANEFVINTLQITDSDGNMLVNYEKPVLVAVTGVSLDTTKIELLQDNSRQMTVNIDPSDASNKNVTWSSDKETVATVSDEGLITGVGEGTATITATTMDGGFKAECEVTVTPIDVAVDGVSLDTTAVELVIGDTQQLTATVTPDEATNKDVTWSSSNDSIVTVSDEGLITAVAEGRAIITVTTNNGGLTADCDVTVIPVAVTGVSLDLTSVELLAGVNQKLTATVLPEEAKDKNVTWSSSNDAVATVSDDGMITAVREGSAIITVTTEDGNYTATCNVTVTNPPVQDLELHDGKNIYISQFDGYSDDAIVTIYATVTNTNNYDVGWGIGRITDIAYAKDNTDFATLTLNAQSVSAEGSVNAFQFTVGQLKAMASISPSDLETLKSESAKAYGPDWTVNDQNYIVDPYNNIGLAINIWHGTLTRVTIQGSEDLPPEETQTPANILDFESDDIGTVYPVIAWNTTDINAVVESNPDGNGNSLHVTTTNWNAYPKFHVILPDNATLGDILKMTLDIYFVDNGSDQNTYKNIDYFLDNTGASFTPNGPTGSAVNIIKNDSTGVWIKKEFALVMSGDVAGRNEFDFGIGVTCATGDYYIDNITFSTDPIAVTGVSLDSTSLEMNSGETHPLTATVTPSDATNQNVTWSSSDEKVATVSNSGIVTAVNEGSAVITVTTVDGKFTATCTVNVTNQDVKVTEEQQVGVDGIGKMVLSLMVPENSLFSGTFQLKLPDGILLNVDSTRLAGDLATQLSLTIEQGADSSWLFTIEPLALRSLTDLVYAPIVEIAYTVDETVPAGRHQAVINDLFFEFDDGTTISQDSLQVTITVLNQTGINKLSGGAYAYLNKGRLYIQSPVAETIHVYSINGVLLYNFKKPAGSMNYPIDRSKGSILIVKGLSIGTKKLIMD